MIRIPIFFNYLMPQNLPDRSGVGTHMTYPIHRLLTERWHDNHFSKLFLISIGRII